MVFADRRVYIDHLLEGDLCGARRLIEGLLDRYSAERIILDYLAPAQAEIGRRWETNRCSVADEHVATSITDAVLAQVGAAIPAPTAQASFAVACVEGDWHTVPARMAAELLRAQGYHVRFLGGSLPADDLERYLAKLRPAGVCLSCSLPLFVPGALRSIEAAHRAGIPVLAGGRGFGRDQHVALRAGADAWARSIAASKPRLRAWSRTPPQQLASPAVDTQAWSAIELASTNLVDYTMSRLADVVPSIRGLDSRQLLRTREDLAYIFQFLAVSLLVDDNRIFVEALVWLSGVLTSRNVPPSTIPATLPILTEALGSARQLTPRTQRLLRQAATKMPETTAAT